MDSTILSGDSTLLTHGTDLVGIEDLVGIMVLDGTMVSDGTVVSTDSEVSEAWVVLTTVLHTMLESE